MSEQPPQKIPLAVRIKYFPNKGIIFLLLGIALAAFLLGLWQAVLKPAAHATNVKTQTESALATIDEWPPISNPKMEDEPVLDVLEDGTLRYTVTYSGSRVIQQQNVSYYCQSLQMPRGWELAECGISNDSNNTFIIIIERPGG